MGALYVFDENYWKRRCVEKLGWQNCLIAEHGLTWKQLFFEVGVMPGAARTGGASFPRTAPLLVVE